MSPIPSIRSLLVLATFGLHLTATPSQAQVGQRGEAVQRAAALYGEANQALEAADTARFVSAMSQAESLRPGHQTLILQRAYAYAVAGKTTEAIATMQRYVDHGFVPTADLSQIPEFEPLLADDRWGPVATRLAANRLEVGIAREAYRLETPDFIPEGIALDPSTGDFYVGSVHRGEIVRIRDGVAEPFAGPEDGLWSAMGMRLDDQRRHLWVATTAAPNFRGLDPDDAGRTAVLRFDLNRPSDPPVRFERDEEGPHWYGDLVVARDGTVYVSDSQGSAVYSIRPGSNSLETLVESPDFPSPQGIDIAPDGMLYLADYSTGLFRIDPGTGDYQPVQAADGVSLLGIDGLYSYGPNLVAIHNGILPHRVVRLFLSRDGTRVDRAETLETNRPWFAEPTLGTVVGDDLYFVANSQWFLFDNEGNLPTTADLVPPLIVKRPLR